MDGLSSLARLVVLSVCCSYDVKCPFLVSKIVCEMCSVNVALGTYVPLER